MHSIQRYRYAAALAALLISLSGVAHAAPETEEPAAETATKEEDRPSPAEREWLAARAAHENGDDDTARARLRAALQHDPRHPGALSLAREMAGVPPSPRNAPRVAYEVLRIDARGGGAPTAHTAVITQTALVREYDVEVSKTSFIADPQPETAQDGAVVQADVVATQQTRHAMRRTVALRAVAALRRSRSTKTLVEIAVGERDPRVRTAAADALRSLTDADPLPDLLGHLSDRSQRRRENAVRAIAALGDERAVAYLVYRFEKRGGGAPRSYAAFLSQEAFIRDFDVEVG